MLSWFRKSSPSGASTPPEASESVLEKPQEAKEPVLEKPSADEVQEQVFQTSTDTLQPQKSEDYVTRINSWLRKQKPDSSESKQTESLSEEASVDSFQVQEKTQVVADPVVVEFFKEFPEPYRQKAIERFSKRAGLSWFDSVRNDLMEKEMRAARTGVFLEDQREWDENVRRDRKLKRDIYHEERYQSLEDRTDLWAWERRLANYFPLAWDESMLRKCLIAGNIAVLGVVMLRFGYRYPINFPEASKLRVKLNRAGNTVLFVGLEVAAVYRMMDWGFFDRTHDRRNLFEKIGGQMEDEFESVCKFVKKTAESIK